MKANIDKLKDMGQTEQTDLKQEEVKSPIQTIAMPRMKQVDVITGPQQAYLLKGKQPTKA